MAISIELEFDKKTDVMIREIWKAMSDARVSTFLHHSSSIPHISLGIFEDPENETAFCDRAKMFLPELNHILVDINGVGVFCGEKKVIYLAVTPSVELIKKHEAFFNHMDRYRDNGWAQYRPSAWVPHVSVAMNPDQSRIPEGVQIALNHFKATRAEVKALGIIHVNPIRPIEHIEL